MSGMGRVGRSGLSLWLLAPIILAGCDDCWEAPCCGNGWHADVEPPAVPAGLAAVTGDGEVFLSWLPCEDADLAGYRIYASDRAQGIYESIGETGRTRFVDYGARNGRTYYYAV